MAIQISMPEMPSWKVMIILGDILRIAFQLLVVVPCFGVIVRLRANYTPRGLQLDEEGTEGNRDRRVGPVVSFFGMLRRIKRIEGWGGFYKGLMPALLGWFLVSPVFFYAEFHPWFVNFLGDVLKFEPLLYRGVLVALYFPITIITYRSITTPYKLPHFRPIYSLRILFTPTERHQPWSLYSIPGLFISMLLQASMSRFFLYTLRHAIEAKLIFVPSNIYGTALLAVEIGVVAVSTLILCPLEVIVAKLATQLQQAAMVQTDSEEEENQEAEAIPQAITYAQISNAGEDVIELRDGKDPYLGFFDCIKRVVREEDWKALYRGWWYTLLVGYWVCEVYTFYL